jgi:hypothetical protein
LSFVLVGAMGFALAHAPPGWQRPGPTALWFAVASGIAVGGIAVVNQVRRSGLVFAVGFLVIFLAIAGMTGERYRLYEKSLRELYLGPPAANNPEALSESLNHGQALQSLMEDFEEDRRRVYETRRPFAVFLRFRLEGWGISQEPWPIVFFLGEILLGGLVGAITAVGWQIKLWEARKSSQAG